tara:strand:- start:3776 stop:4024 length:249 start_codon:yes stop_codon:yes gene_type:complete
MYRLEYDQMIPVTEWFRSHADAMKIVDKLKLERYKIRFVGFPFTPHPEKVDADGHLDPDGNRIFGEEGAILHWLNRWATGGR